MPAPPPPLAPSTARSSRPGPWIIAALVLLLLILHQDNWFWTDDRLVFGIIPIGLFWHACISVAASITWFLSTQIAWPVDSEFDAVVAVDAESATQADEQEEAK